MEPKKRSSLARDVRDPMARRLLDELAATLDVTISSDRTIDYREYTITYHRTLAGWIARFRKTGSFTFVSSYVVAATLDDGVAVLLVRTRAKIDIVCAKTAR